MKRFLFAAGCCALLACSQDDNQPDSGPAAGAVATPLVPDTPAGDATVFEKSTPESSAAETPPPVEPLQQEAASPDAGTSPQRETAQPPPDPAAFGQMLQEVLALEQDARFSEALKLCQRMRTTFPEHPDASQLGKIGKRLHEEKMAAPGLSFAVEKLASDSEVETSVAAEKIRAAGQAGRIVLRKTFRQGSDEIARKAAGILIDMDDEQSVPMFLERLGKQPEPALGRTLIAGLCSLAKRVDPYELAALYPFVKDDSGFERRGFVPLLSTMFQQLCGGDQAKFNELVGDIGAFARLQSYCASALTCEDEEVFNWALANLGPFVAEVPGLRGSYFADNDFQGLVYEQLDFQIDVPNRKSLSPHGHPDVVSARWTGSLRIDEPGEYSFHCNTNGDRRLWLDDELLIDDEVKKQKNKKTRLDLAAGSHSLKVEFSQKNRQCAIKLLWSGPGFEKQPVPRDVLRTAPWENMKIAGTQRPKQSVPVSRLPKKQPKRKKDGVRSRDRTPTLQKGG